MSEQFKVGEICIGQNFVISTYRNGAECQVIGGLKVRRCDWVTGVSEHTPCYEVRWADGYECNVLPDRLRRKPPKQDYTEWAASKVRDLTKPVTQPEKEIA